MTIEIMGGTPILKACEDAVRQAGLRGCVIEFDFNGIPMVASATDDPEYLVHYYDSECERRRVAYEASPAGQEAAAKRAEFARKATEAEAAGILPFDCADPVIWQSWVDANREDYGACIMRYAARWAHMMDAAIVAGETVDACADRLSHEADIEGITGFMYGAAVGVLAQAWRHGEALRRWHNLKTQIGHEGERANEAGGTLNPALLNIGS